MSHRSPGLTCPVPRCPALPCPSSILTFVLSCPAQLCRALILVPVLSGLLVPRPCPGPDSGPDHSPDPDLDPGSCPVLPQPALSQPCPIQVSSSSAWAWLGLPVSGRRGLQRAADRDEGAASIQPGSPDRRAD